MYKCNNNPTNDLVLRLRQSAFHRSRSLSLPEAMTSWSWIPSLVVPHPQDGRDSSAEGWGPAMEVSWHCGYPASRPRAITPLAADGSIWCPSKWTNVSQQQGSQGRFRKCCQTMIMILTGDGAGNYIFQPIIYGTYFLPLSRGHCYGSSSQVEKGVQCSWPQFTWWVIGRTCGF